MTFDYRTLYSEEPMRFRGLGVLPQGQPPCGVSTVGPAPTRKATIPAAFRGLGRAVELHPCNLPDAAFIQRELDLGKNIEQEHTRDPEGSTCIAKHHLIEEAKEKRLPLTSPKLTYYTDLVRMEKKWKKSWRRRRGTKGYGAWVPEAATSSTPGGPVTVPGEVESKCPGLIIYQSTCEKDRRTGKFMWIAAHKATGQSILRTTNKGDARRLAKALCQEIRQCQGISWASSAEELRNNQCAYSAAIRAQETWKPKATLRKVKRRK